MPDDTHDMRLLAFVVDGVAQRLAVDGERLVVPAVLLVPALQRAVELFGGDADQEGTDGGLARGLADPIAQPDPEPFEGFVPERIDPIRRSTDARLLRPTCNGSSPSPRLPFTRWCSTWSAGDCFAAPRDMPAASKYSSLPTTSQSCDDRENSIDHNHCAEVLEPAGSTPISRTCCYASTR